MQSRLKAPRSAPQWASPASLCAALCTGALLLGSAQLVQAQTGAAAPSFPNRTVRIVLPYAAGGASDVLARALAQKLSVNLGQPTIVENRAGATGIVGTDVVAKAAPDGHTLLWAVSAHTILPGFNIKLPYDSERDFAPVTQLTAQGFVVIANPGFPAKSVADLIALAKAKPGSINFGSGGSGNMTHIGFELMKSMAGIEMVHVPYKGGGPAAVAVMAGEVPLLLASVGTISAQLKAGKVRALAVTGGQRLRALPDVPAVKETVPGYEVTSWYGIMAPARTPAPLVARWHAELLKAMTAPDMKERVDADGSELVMSTPEAFGRYVHDEIIKWTKVIQASGAKLE